MSMQRTASLLAAVIFLALAALALYRLMVGFRITIGNVEVGHTSTFFAFVIFSALTLIMLRGAKASD